MSFYPKLNESPDEVKAPHPEHDYYRNIAEFDDDDAYAFGFKNGKALISRAKKSHGDMLKEIGIDPWDVRATDARKYFKYPGRIWIEKKLISFWLYPKDNSELHKLMELLEDAFAYVLNIELDIWNEFQIEINIDESGLDNFGAHRYGEWERFRMHDIKIIPVKDYKSSKNNSAQAIASPHRKPESNAGFGSKHPQYQGKQKEKRYMAAESYYPLLNESPDMIEASNLKDVTGFDNLNFVGYGAWPFGYYDGKMMCGKEDESHIQMSNNRYQQEVLRYEFDFPGRVWPVQKIISFWRYPTPKEFKKVLNDIVDENRRKYGDSNYVDFNDPEWKIEVISQKIPDADEDDLEPFEDAWDLAMDSKLIPFSEYTGSLDQSKKKQGQAHADSPMNKEKSDKPMPNVGSKHPKYQSREAEKRYMAAESYYPKLNENPNEIIDPEYWKNVKNPNITADQLNRIRWKDTENITFSYYDGKLAAQSNEDDQAYTHYDLARDFRPDNQKYSVAGNGRGDFGGRLYTKYKVVTFWRFPETHKALYDILSDLENKMGIQILDDPEWVIEIPGKETKGGLGGPWQPRMHRMGDVKFIPLKNYKGGHKRTRSDMETPHKAPDSNYGGGSKLTAWDAEKNIKQRQKETTSESFYPKLKK